MSWQAEVYMWLRQAPGERWMYLGELFERVRVKIPLHYAMRNAVRLSHKPDVLPGDGDHAQWQYFKSMLHRMNVEHAGGPSKRWQCGDRVRLRWIDGRACERCGGPVVWATWSGRTDVVCHGESHGESHATHDGGKGRAPCDTQQKPQRPQKASARRGRAHGQRAQELENATAAQLVHGLLQV